VESQQAQMSDQYNVESRRAATTLDMAENCDSGVVLET